EDGSTVTRSGRGIVYSGYSWRGRSTTSDSKAPSESREAMFVSRDWATMEGRWFWGAYDEYGIDVSLRRIATEPLIVGVNPVGLKTKTTGLQIHIYGANLPADIRREEIDLGPGVTVKRIVSAQNDDLTVEVDVADGASNGYRDISIRR